MNLYQQTLMDHYRYPRNRGTIVNPDFSSDQHNPSCGDSISMQGIVTEGVVTQVAFQGSGCVISLAAASLLCEFVTDKELNEVGAIDAEKMLALVGMPLGPVRVKCALLARDALQAGINKYRAVKNKKVPLE